MNTNERIQDTLGNNAIVLYMKGSPQFPQCGFSGKAVQLLQSVGAKFESVDVLADPDIREGIKQFSNWPTIPQLYIKGEFVGGSDIMVQLYENGELKKLVESTN